MGTTMVSLRLEDELAEWATGYAKERGVSRSDLLAEAIESFREDCSSGVPRIRERVRALRVAEAPGVRPSREGFARATAARSELFRGLVAPASTRGIKPSKEKESK